MARVEWPSNSCTTRRSAPLLSFFWATILGLIYLQVREKIETSGRDNRWEFDRRRLFERTTYMANICSDLRQVVVVSDEFARFLGPELKAVTGDAIGIDDVIAQVAQMLKPIENLPFDPWDKRYSSQCVD
mgnify:CR=1 FL=1